MLGALTILFSITSAELNPVDTPLLNQSFFNMKLFVARLDYGVTSDALRSVFEDFGTVSSCSVVNDRETGQSRGFAFVEMPNQQEAMTAMREVNGMEFRGREVVVKQAEDRKARY